MRTVINLFAASYPLSSNTRTGWWAVACCTSPIWNSWWIVITYHDSLSMESHLISWAYWLLRSVNTLLLTVKSHFSSSHYLHRLAWNVCYRVWCCIKPPSGIVSLESKDVKVSRYKCIDTTDTVVFVLHSTEIPYTQLTSTKQTTWPLKPLGCTSDALDVLLKE